MCRDPTSPSASPQEGDDPPMEKSGALLERHPLSSPWPEDDMDGLGLWNVLQRWSYAYLNPLLNTGSQQRKDNFRLEQDHLYKVPRSMSSILLDNHFR